MASSPNSSPRSSPTWERRTTFETSSRNLKGLKSLNLWGTGRRIFFATQGLSLRITQEFQHPPSRAPDYEAESRALSTLARELASTQLW
jgi:hypothetical protein